MLIETISLFGKPLLETIYMVCLSTGLATLGGLPLGICLFITNEPHLLYHKPTYRVLSMITNAVRSIPYIILMIAIIPLTRFIVGSSIGTNAAIVSLTISAIPFVARLVETALGEVPAGLIEAGLSMGASTGQIIRQFLLPESAPVIISGVTLTMVNLVGYSAMAGAIGGGGLGDLAIRYGYQRFDVKIMLLTIVILILLVQVLQTIGDRIARWCDKR